MISRLLSRGVPLPDRLLYAAPKGSGSRRKPSSSGAGKLRGWLLRGPKRGTVLPTEPDVSAARYVNG
jgi:hypothetical protein